MEKQITKREPRLNVERVLDILKADGVLGKSLPGFEPREAQQKMLIDIVDLYNHKGIALIEAGTGTGKSIAYLLPALLWAVLYNERTLISTNTITLQEQLIHKDIPQLIKALNLDVKAVLVKGMNNYLCLRKLEDTKHELRVLSPAEATELEKIEEWAGATKDGSRSDLGFVPSYTVWDKVGAEKDACNHRECPYYKDCYFFKARRNANDAQILVANHHMLFADLAVRAEDEGSQPQGLLPTYTRLILDEAHNIEDVATEYFAARVAKLGMLRNLAKLSGDKQGKLNLLKLKLQTFYRGQPPNEITSIFTQLSIDLPGMRRNLLQEIDNTFFAYEEFARLNASKEEASGGELKQRLLHEHLKQSSWLEEVVPSTKKLVEALTQFFTAVQCLDKALGTLRDERLEEQIRSLRVDINSLSNRLFDSSVVLKNFIGEHPPTQVRWIEIQALRTTPNVHLVDAELDIASHLSKWLFDQFSTIVLCSATLTTNKQFNFIRNRLGITEKLLSKTRIIERIYESPFNYQKQALFAIPTDISNPADPDFIRQASEQIWKVIQASRGNAFVLFTSHGMLKTCYEHLSQRLIEHRFPILKQGDTNRQALLNKFKTTDRSVLFGTDSFWEGVDVVGDALRCVILVKLPFRVPSDPMIEARAEAILANGGDPFVEYLLPNAIVKFKQGFGRLIRNQKDRGCIVCLDTRLLNKGYGKYFLNSLPQCQQVFSESSKLQNQMQEFYRKTHHFTTKS